MDDVEGISDWSLFKEAAVNVINQIDPAETVRRATIDIFDGVYTYDPADDVKEIVDIRPQTTSRTTTDNASRVFSEEFDQTKSSNDFTLEYQDGTKILRYARDVGNSINITETIDDNFTAGTGVSNIAEDTVVFAESNRSLRFDVSSGSNLLTWDGDSVIDLSGHTNKSSFFLWVYIPDSSLFTSITVRVGSSSTNYYEITGALFFGSIRSGWNLYRFNWNGATETGTTDETAIDYVRFAIVMSSADTDIRIGTLSSKLPTPREYLYYSSYLFRTTSGTWLETPNNDDNIVNIDTDGHNIFIEECCLLIADGLTRPEAAQKHLNRLYGTAQQVGLYDRYKTRKPPEPIKPQTSWRKLSYNRK